MTPMIVEHPLLQHKISLLRNKQSGTKEFRDLVGEIATAAVLRGYPRSAAGRGGRSRPPSPWQRPRCWQAASWLWCPSCAPAWVCWTVC